MTTAPVPLALGMRVHHLICDLDGTLVDSLPGIECSTRHALAKCLPGVVAPPMRDVVGPPIAKMFAQLWPQLPCDELDCLLAAFRQHYNEEGCLASVCYPGVRETLSELRKREVEMFVLTNKPLAPTQTILRHTGIEEFFAGVVSPDTAEPSYLTKSAAAKALRDVHALAPASTAIVGDGLDDAAAAAACGFAFFLAAYGYGSAAVRGTSGSRVALKFFAEILSFA